MASGLTIRAKSYVFLATERAFTESRSHIPTVHAPNIRRFAASTTRYLSERLPFSTSATHSHERAAKPIALSASLI